MMWVLQDGSYQLLHAEDGEAAPLKPSAHDSFGPAFRVKGGLVQLSWTTPDLNSSKREGRVPLYECNGSTRVCPGEFA